MPSLVITMPPIGSRSILSIERGPIVVRTMSETAFPAAMFESCAFRPVSRCTCWFITMIGAPPMRDAMVHGSAT